MCFGGPCSPEEVYTSEFECEPTREEGLEAGIDRCVSMIFFYIYSCFGNVGVDTHVCKLRRAPVARFVNAVLIFCFALLLSLGTTFL